MPYVAPEVVQRVKQIDLLTYLKNYEPYELVHFSGNVYTTRSHDSLKISNGKWMWWSRGIGGRSALDYLIKVRGYDFVQAVQMIAEHLVMRLCVESVQIFLERRPEVTKTILSVFQQRKNAGQSICLSQPLTCYLTPQNESWTEKTGERNICYPLQVCISRPKKSRKAKFRQR